MYCKRVCLQFCSRSIIGFSIHSLEAAKLAVELSECKVPLEAQSVARLLAKSGGTTILNFAGYGLDLVLFRYRDIETTEMILRRIAGNCCHERIPGEPQISCY